MTHLAVCLPCRCRCFNNPAKADHYVAGFISRRNLCQLLLSVNASYRATFTGPLCLPHILSLLKPLSPPVSSYELPPTPLPITPLYYVLVPLAAASCCCICPSSRPRWRHQLWRTASLCRTPCVRGAHAARLWRKPMACRPCLDSCSSG